MVSFKRFFLNLILPVTAVLFLILFTSYAYACPAGQADCCKEGKLSCCVHPGYDSHGNELGYDISGCSDIEEDKGEESGDISEGEEDISADCLAGIMQYRAAGSCDTEKNQCCPNGQWSGWAKTPQCSNSCTNIGEDKPGQSGAPCMRCYSPGEWGVYGCTTDAGECFPSGEREGGGPHCGERVCGSNGYWGEWEYYCGCDAGQTRECGNCGIEKCTAQEDWSGICEDPCACPPYHKWDGVECLPISNPSRSTSSAVVTCNGNSANCFGLCPENSIAREFPPGAYITCSTYGQSECPGQTEYVIHGDAPRISCNVPTIMISDICPSNKGDYQICAERGVGYKCLLSPQGSRHELHKQSCTWNNRYGCQPSSYPPWKVDEYPGETTVSYLTCLPM